MSPVSSLWSTHVCLSCHFTFHTSSRVSLLFPPASETCNDFHPMFFTHDRSFEEFFCICIQLLNKTWKEMRATSEDFNKVSWSRGSISLCSPSSPPFARPLAVCGRRLAGRENENDRGFRLLWEWRKTWSYVRVGDAVTSLGICLQGLCSFRLTKLEPQQSLSCEK